MYVSFNTVEYVDNNLFVVVPQFDVKFSTCNGQLDPFADNVSKLMTIKEDTEHFATSAAVKLESSRENRNLMTFNSVRNRSLSLSHFTTIPSTIHWFTPPKNDFIASAAPSINSELFKNVPDNEFWSDDKNDDDDLLNERLIALADDRDNEDEDFVYTEKG